MSHSAEIIAVGTELLLGNITNTNARDISRALSAVGVNVFWHTVVGDNGAAPGRAGHCPQSGGHHHYHRRSGAHL